MKVISLINMKGGVAKTTLSVNIADYLNRRSKKSVLVIDVDPQFNATQCLMSPSDYVAYISEGKDTIINVFDRNFRPSISFVEGSATRSPKKLEEIEPLTIKPGFKLLPGALDLYKLEMAPGEGREYRIRNYLNTVREEYDYVIIDTPPTPSVWMTSALLASDHYLIPVKPDPISMTGIDLLNGIISEKTENFGIKINCCGVVLTVIEENTITYKNAISNLDNADRWRGKRFARGLPKRTAVAREQLLQRMILDMDDSHLKSNFASIVNELIERTD